MLHGCIIRNIRFNRNLLPCVPGFSAIPSPGSRQSLWKREESAVGGKAFSAMTSQIATYPEAARWHTVI
ncbi:MAG TPA: hypothetical protein DIT89_16470 [Planctomycetaceae bacterium]|nr:hypothetical protein [Planctomycetaceae bacterium]